MAKKWDEDDARMLSPLKLAYIGDAVYEMMIRGYFLKNMKGSLNEINKNATKYVKAESQAKVVYELESFLSEEENGFIRRGRNAKSKTSPKNANIQDYRYATGLETLLGYLYLIGKEERLEEIFNFIVDEIIERVGEDDEIES